MSIADDDAPWGQDEIGEVVEELADEHGPLALPGLFVAPTEPRSLKAMGKVSSLPEQFGCDVLWMHGGNRYGVQRKEWRDLLASVEDGRLGKECGQMHSAGVRGVLAVEGTATWAHGEIVTGYGRSWSRRQWWGVQLAVQLEGVWLIHTANIADTSDFIRAFNIWTKKKMHGSLGARPGPKGLWGTRADDRDWAKHVLTSFPGIGPGAADAIFEEFGRAPLRWDCEKADLRKVKGLGAKKVEAIWGALNKEVTDG
jgi:ERCC4-type nuclease